MSLAQRFERRLEGLVGGAFARVFKGQVEPVEIGTALQREAADRKNIMGNGQVMCPNRYRVTLAPSDHERLLPWEGQLASALAELVQEHLDENRWTTIGDIEVYLARDDELHTGVFGVASRMESNAPPRRRPHDSLSMPVAPGPAPDQYPQPSRPERQPQPTPPPTPPPSAAPQRAAAALVVDSTNQRFELRHGSNVIGRGSDSDLQLMDQGVSRRHVDVQYDGQRATVYDLGSTNGTTVNGHEVGSHVLRHGDVVRVGHTRMVFNRETA
ncbi:MAG: FhaA domain-containing protein [Jatrophihabitantaceae bacterium]